MLPADGTASAGALRGEPASRSRTEKRPVWAEQNENRGGCDTMERQEGAR